jgi:ABC-type Mn2+/Zn2+ transport system permease subunit
MTFESLILDPLSYAFMRQALIAAVLTGALSGIVGVYVVTRGMAFLGDALAHSVLPGVAIAFLTGGSSGQGLLVGGLIAAILSAISIGFLTRGRRLAEDTAIGIVFAGMLALGVALISQSQNFALDLSHALLGNILAVSGEDLLMITVVGGIVLAAIGKFYNEFLIISFDPTLAQTLKLPAERLRILLLVLLAITVVIGVQVVGVALVSAMLVTPAATARFYVKRLHQMMGLAALIGALCSVFGVFIAWHLNVETSAAIVLTMTTVFALSFLFAPHVGYIWSVLGRSARTA